MPALRNITVDRHTADLPNPTIFRNDYIPDLLPSGARITRSLIHKVTEAGLEQSRPDEGTFARKKRCSDHIASMVAMSRVSLMRAFQFADHNPILSETRECLSSSLPARIFRPSLQILPYAFLSTFSDIPTSVR